MTLPDLPQDVFDEIFNQLMDKTSTLKSCSLVCRSFRHNAQKILFRSIVVVLPSVDDDYRNSRRINHLVLIVNGASHLIEYIQHLKIDGDSISEPQDVDNDFTDLADALGTFSRKGESFLINLQSLWLQALSWCLIHPMLQDALALLMTVPSLLDITLRGQIDRPADLVQNLPPLLKDLPITSFLSLPTIRNELPELESLTIPCLQHLSMRGILLDQFLSDGMQGIVDMTRLKTFDTDVFEVSMSLIEQFLRPASNSLKHLTLRFMDLTSDPDLVPIDLSRFSHLTNITINILSIPSRIFPAVILIPRMMKTIPHQNVIQNLSFCLLPCLLPIAIFGSAMKDSWQELDTICFIPQLALSKSFRGITFIIDSSVYNCDAFWDFLQNKLPKTKKANKLRILKVVEGRW